MIGTPTLTHNPSNPMDCPVNLVAPIRRKATWDNDYKRSNRCRTAYAINCSRVVRPVFLRMLVK